MYFTLKVKMQSIITGCTIFILAVLVTNSVFAQTFSTIYTQNFGTGTSFPTGWVDSTGTGALNANMSINTASSSTVTPTYTGASGGSNLADGNTPPTPGIGTAYVHVRNAVNTQGYSNVTLSFGERKTSSYTGTVSLYWSADNGTTWNTITYVGASTNGNWTAASGSGLSLPAGASNVANLCFRLKCVRSNTSGNYRMDDFIVTGTYQSSNVTFSSVSSLSASASWTNGGGTKHAVFVAQATSGTATPVNGTTYTANTAFGSGSQIGSSGWYCVYNDVGSSVNLTGLTANTAYRVMVCDYTGSAGSEVYNVASVTGNPANTNTLAAVSATKLAVIGITPTSPYPSTGFSVLVQSQDGTGAIANVSSATAFSLSTNGNAGAIGGTVAGTIASGNNSITVSGVTLASTGTGATLTATRTSGDALTAGTSTTFNVIALPNIAITNTSPTAMNIGQGNPGVLLQTINLAVTNNPVTLNGLTISTAGTYGSTEIANLKCWYSTTSTFSSGTATLLSTISSPGVAGNYSFPAFTSQNVPVGTGYLFITMDVANTVVAGHTINIASTSFSNLGTTPAVLSGTNPIPAAAVFTLQGATDPLPFNLASSSYSFTTWANTNSVRTYPPNMWFHVMNAPDPLVTATAQYDYTGVYNGSSGTRMTGQGSNGFAFLNTSTGDSLGEAVLALNTTGRINTSLTWTSGVITVSTGRIYGIRAQYRIGTSGAYTDLPNTATSQIEYVGGASIGSANFGPITLPSTCDNQPVVEVRWIYYYSSGSSGRPEMNVTNIAASAVLPAATLTGTTTICAGNNATISVTGGTSLATVTLSPGGASFSLNASGSGSITVNPATTTAYTATVTKSGVTAAATGSVTISVNPLPTPTFTSSPTFSICSGIPVTYATQSGQSAYSWTLPGTLGADYTITSGSTGSTSSSVTVNWNTGGAKSVQVNYSSAGCAGTSAASSSTTVSITPAPMFLASPATYTCKGNTVYYTTQSGQSAYTWSVPGVPGTDFNIYSGGTGSSNNSVAIIWLTNGSKTVSVGYSTASCPSLVNATNTTTVSPNPTAYSISGNSSFCAGTAGADILVSNSESGIGYQLYLGGTPIGSAITGTGGSPVDFGYQTTGGVYSVSATNSTSGCSTVMTGSDTVTILTVASPGIISGAASVCPGSITTLSETTTGGTWQSSDASIATTDASGVVSSAGTGSVLISYSVTNTCGTSTATFNFGVSSTPSAGVITGATSVCAGNTITIADATPGGSWTSSNTSIATINTSGIISGVSAGTDTIYYIVSTPCGSADTFFIITVNPLPATPSSIGGGNSLCNGSVLILFDGLSGGSWTSSNTSVATVDGSGNVSGTGAGNAVISYTNTNGCGSSIVTQPITVNPLPIPPSALSLPSGICVGGSTTLSNSVTGGSWLSNNTAVATINSTSGILNALTTGNSVISYSTSNSCGSSTTTATLNVITTPSAPASITGTLVTITGGTTTLADVTPSGTWASQNTGVANISTSGVVSGVGIGTTTITYTETNICGSSYVTTPITVNSSTPNINFTNSPPGGGNVRSGVLGVILQTYNLTVSNVPVTLSGLVVPTSGTYASADLTNLKCWLSTHPDFSTTTATLLSTYSTPGASGNKTFPSFVPQTIPVGAAYIFITADIAGSATAGNTIAIGTTAFSNFSLGSATYTGTNPVAAGSTYTFAAYTDPANYSLSNGDWNFFGWSSTANALTYPGNNADGVTTTGQVTPATSANMVFHNMTTTDPAVTAVPGGDYTGTYSNSSGTRITGVGTSGVYFCNTSSGTNLGEAVLGLNTTGRNNIYVSWQAATLSVGSRTYKLRGQYRVGNSGSFTDLPNTAIGQVEYTSSSTLSVDSAYGPILLPGSCNNQPCVQIRWIYYNVSGSSNRPAMALSNINVTSTAIGATPNVTIASTGADTAYITPGTANVVLQSYIMDVASYPTTFNSLSVRTGGTFTSSDITNLKLWYSGSSTFAPGTSTLLSTISTPASAGLLAFPSFSQYLPVIGGTKYFYITADISGSATLGHTIFADTTSKSNLGLGSAILPGTYPLPGGGTQYIEQPSVQTFQLNPGTSFLSQSTQNNVIQTYGFGVSAAPALLTGLTFSTSGNYLATDLSNLKCWYATSPVFSLASATLLSTISSPTAAGSMAFPAFSQIFPISSGVDTGYIFITADMSATAVSGDSIRINTLPFANLGMGVAILSGTNPIPASNYQKIAQPLVNISDSAFAPYNAARGRLNVVLQAYDLAVSTAPAVISGLSVITAGTYSSTDISDLKCWYANSSTFDPATAILLSSKSSALGAGTQTFPAFIPQELPLGNGYIFITTDIALTATVGNNINIGSCALSGFGLGNAIVSGTNPVAAASSINIITATDPEPYVLDSGDYSFYYWPNTAAAGTYPPNMVFHFMNATDPTLIATAAGDYSALYSYIGNTRCSGNGFNGFSMVNSGSANPGGPATTLGESVFGFNSAGRINIQVSWTVGTIVAAPNGYKLRCQYRIGTTGTYTDLPYSAIGDIEYTPGIVGSTHNFGPITLPSSCENKSDVELRWVYYHASGSGLDPEINITNIQVSSSPAPVPNVDISATSPATGNVIQGATNALLQTFNLNVTSASTYLNYLTLYTGGYYVASDLTNLKCWYSTSPDFSPGTSTLLKTLTSGLSVGAHTFSSLARFLPIGTGYIFITADVSSSATLGHSTNIGSNPLSNFSFPGATISGSDPAASANMQTFIAPPSVAISGYSPAAGNIHQFQSNILLDQLGLSVSNLNATLAGLTITTTGTYSTGDFTDFKLWLSTDSTFNTDSILLISTISAPATIGNQVFPFSGTVNLPIGKNYLFITADASTTAVIGHSIAVSTTSFSNINVSGAIQTGTNPVLGSSTQTLTVTEPTPYDLLANGNYTFDSWPSTSSAGTYPPSIMFHYLNSIDPSLSSTPSGDYFGSYAVTGNAQIEGQGSNGFVFYNKGGANLGEAVLALNTTGLINNQISWTSGTFGTGVRTYAVRGQYRIGTSGSYSDLTHTSLSQIEDTSSTTAGTYSNFGPITLPSSCDNQPVVEIRWVYYYAGTITGTRPLMNVTNVVASGNLPTAAISQTDSICPGGHSTLYVYGGTPGATINLSDSTSITLDDTGYGSAVFSPSVTTVYSGIVKKSGVSNPATGNYTVYVRPLPNAGTIGGNNTLCVGDSLLLTETQSGGNWTSSNASIGPINTTTGEVYGTSAGSENITYTLTDGHCTNFTVKAISINPIPAFALTPSNSAVCTGAITTIKLPDTLTLLSQNFESSPSWTDNFSGSPASMWSRRSNGYVTGTSDSAVSLSTTNGSFFYICDGNAGGATLKGDTLYAPAISLLGMGSAYLNYSSWYQHAAADSFCGVEITKDGVHWSVLDVPYSSGTAGGAQSLVSRTAISLNAYLGFNNVQLRFRYNSAFGYAWAIDNIYVKALPAPVQWAAIPGLYSDSAMSNPVTSATLTPQVYFEKDTLGIYTVTARIGGCNVSGVSTITVNALPVSTGPTYDPLCVGGTLSLHANADTSLTYLWSGPSAFSASGANPSLASVDLSANGVYSVTLSRVGFAGCHVLLTTPSVNVLPKPTVSSVSSSDSLLCTGSAIRLTANTVSGTGTHVLFWSGPAGFTDTSLADTVGITLSSPTYAGTYSVVAAFSGNGCISSAVSAPSITVNAQPAIDTITMSAAGIVCPGTLITLVASTTGGAGIPNFVWTGPDISSPFSTSALNTLSVTPASPGSYTVVVSYTGTGCNSATKSSLAENPQPQQWTGATNSDWFTVSNWSCGYVPGTNDSALIGTSLHEPEVTVSSPVLIRDLKLKPGASISIDNSATLVVTGDLTNNGTIRGAGTLSLAGTLTQTVLGNGMFTNILLNNPAGATINNSTDTMTVVGQLTLSSGTLTTNDRLVIYATTDSFAKPVFGMIPQIPESGASISGRVIMQQYLTLPHRAYVFWGHPFKDSLALTQLEKSVDITGSYGTGHGFTATATNAPSAYWYDTRHANSAPAGGAADPGWMPFNWCIDTLNHTTGQYSGADTNLIHPYQGIRWFFRGNKGEGLDGSTPVPLPTNVRQWGYINTGNIAVPLRKGYQNANEDYNMVGNPYPSPVDIGTVIHNAWTSGELASPKFYVWYAAGAAAGMFRTYDETALTPYVISENTAFQVRSADSNKHLYFSEANKASRPTEIVLKSAPGAVALNIYDSSYHVWDVFNLQLDEHFTDKEEPADGRKPVNPDLNFYSWSADHHPLSVDMRPFDQDKIIPMGITSNYLQHFIIRADNIDISDGQQIYLHDKFLGQYVLLSQGTEYGFDITKDAASQGDNRFELGLHRTEANTTDSARHLNVLLVPNPASNDLNISFSAPTEAETSLRILTMEGVCIYSQNLGLAKVGSLTLPVENLANGLYMVELISGNDKVVKRMVKEN